MTGLWTLALHAAALGCFVCGGVKLFDSGAKFGRAREVGPTTAEKLQEEGTTDGIAGGALAVIGFLGWVLI